MKTLMRIFIFAALAVSPLYPQQPKEWRWPSGLESMIRRLTAEHPLLQAMDHDVRASESRRGEFTAWDPPQIGIEFFQIPAGQFPNPFGKNMETDYFIQQMIPWPGKKSAMGNVIPSSASAISERKNDQANRLIFELKTLYIELTANRSLREINRQRQAVMEQLQRVTENRIVSGGARVSDALMIRSELAMIELDHAKLLRQNGQMRAMMTALNVSFDDSLLKAEISVPDSLSMDAERIAQVALVRHPALKSMDWEIMMNRKEITALRKEQYPDFMVRAMYKNMMHSPKDFWSVMIGVTVPVAWWSKPKYDAMAGEREWKIRRTEKEIGNMRNEIRSEIDQTLSGLSHTGRIIRIMRRQIIPDLQAAYEQETARFSTDPMASAMVMESAQKLLKVREELVMAETEYLKGIAGLERIAGVSIAELIAESGKEAP